MTARHATYADRQRQIEAGARKRREAKREEREMHAEHVTDAVLDMLRETGQNEDMQCSVMHNPRTGRYTVQIGKVAKTYTEKDLTAYIATEYAKQHEVELTDNIPEDDK